jgi:hypothetical protein
VLPPVISGRQHDEEHRTDRPLDIFGKRHRRITP